MSEALYRQLVDGAASRLPYRLRPDAKRDHPDVSPLPATWEQCEQANLLEALGAVRIAATARPDFGPPTHSVIEGAPEYRHGAWHQTWTVSELPDPVPQAVAPHLIRRVLAKTGLLTKVEAAIESLPQNDPMRIDWDYAPSISRGSLGLARMAEALNITPEQIDDIFRAASKERA